MNKATVSSKLKHERKTGAYAGRIEAVPAVMALGIEKEGERRTRKEFRDAFQTLAADFLYRNSLNSASFINAFISSSPFFFSSST